MCRVANHQTRLPRATANLALSASRDGASTSYLGNLFQCVNTLCVKNFFLISNLNLPCLSLKPFPLVLSLSTLVNSPSPSCLYVSFKYWKATMRSPWSLLFSILIPCITDNNSIFLSQCWAPVKGSTSQACFFLGSTFEQKSCLAMYVLSDWTMHAKETIKFMERNTVKAFLISKISEREKYYI